MRRRGKIPFPLRERGHFQSIPSEGAWVVISTLRTNTIKSLFILLLFLCVPLKSLFAQTTMNSPEEYLQNGVFEYQNFNFSQALDNFLLAENVGIKNPDLYYNIGNSYYMLNNKPMAIVYYKRALQQDSSHKAAQNNLNYVLDQTTDSQTDETENLLNTVMMRGFYFFSINALLIILLVLFAIFIAMIHIQWRFISLDPTVLRFVNFCVLFILLFFLGVLGARLFLVNDNEGVITNQTVYVYSGPSESFTRLFTIHEGTVLKIKTTEGDWTQMTTMNGFSGWIENSSFVRVISGDRRQVTGDR